jgi:hypothetical protein
MDDATGRLESDAISKDRDMRTFATAATISFVAGGALAAAGLLLLITAPDDSNETAQRTFTPYVGLGSIGAVGTF